MLPLFLAAQAPPPGSALGAKTPTPPKRGPVVVHRAIYAGTLSEKEARFTADLELECTNTVETVLPLFQGDIAVSAMALPAGLRLERTSKGYLLAVGKPGEYNVKFNILAKIAKSDPWRQIGFTGPAATIGSVRAEVAGNGMELELLSGTAQPRAAGEKSKVQGALGPDRRVAMRWQTRVTRQERPALLTVQTTSTVQVTPTVIKYTSVYQYNILQGKPTNVVLILTAGQAVTSVKSNAPLRDRRLENANGQQVLTLDFAQPLTKLYTLTLQTEQPVSQDQNTASLFPPSPQGIERERGQVNLKVQDMKVEPGTPTGLRQVNAAANTVGAWQFFGRDAFAFDIGLRRIDPVITAHDQVIASIEEKRLEVVHSINLKVEKAGIYKAILTPAAGLLPERMITAVNGKGISDWEEQADGSILVEFNARVLGERQVRVVMEAMFDALPAQVALGTLSVGGAQRQTAQIIANPDRGLELKTAQSSGLREAPAIGALAFTAAAAGWQLEVTPRVLPAHIVPRVSNGVIIGDNRVYGYSKILYAINDQGVQEFHVRVPASWQNVQFLGTRKRRELASTPNAAAGAVDHTLTLQDAVWGQYTLQVSYDIPLPEGEGNNTLVLGGTHPLEVDGDGFKLMDRDSGSLVIHSASNIQLSQPETSLSRIDPAELDETERSRITHPVLYAYQYDGGDFQVKVGVGRYREQEMLNAVADYTRLATVVTGTGQIATTASMSVKKTDKDPPVFVLPKGAEFISARIDGKTITPAENDGAYVIPLPGEAGRNRSFEVEISYSEKSGQIKYDDFLRSLQAGHLRLTGPIIRNIPNTFCQWTVYVPEKFEMYNFEGNMVAPPEPKGKKRTLDAAWTQFERSLRWFGGGFVLFGLGLACAFATLMAYLRRGWKGSLIALGTIAGVLAFCAVAFSLMMGGMAKARSNSSGSDMTMEVDAELRETNSDPDDRAYGGEEETPKDDASSPGFDPQSKAEPSRNKPVPTKAPASPKTAVPPPAIPQEPGASGGRPSGGSGPGGAPERDGRATLDPATVVGVLPPEFEIPTDGRPYIFTKALHTASLATESQDDQAARLTIEANIIRQDRRKARGIALEWMVALAGLGLLITQARRRERNSWAITIGFGLMLGGIGKFMLDQGTLHLLFLNSIWVLTLAVAVWATWYFWPAKRHQPTPPPPPSKDEGDSGSGPAPAATTAALLLLLSLSAAQAAAPPPPRDARAWEGLENLLRLLADPDLLLQKPGGPRVIRESQVQDRNGTWFEINQDAPFTGQVVGFFQNRQKRIESNYLAGRLHGARSEWFENGQKQRVSAFDQGRLHGVETTWFRDGAKAMETQYQAGRRHGVHRLWHASGKLAMETPYVKGEPHGLTRQWHANGKIAREVRWESGRQLAFDTWTAEGVRFGEGTNTVSLLHAKYKLAVHREVAQVQAEFQLEARAANQKFTLFRELIAINDFNASQAGAKLLREGPALVLQLPEAGKVTVNLSFLTKHAGDATRRTLAFGIPPALTSVVDVVLQEADSEVEMPTAVKFDTSSGGNQTLVDAIIGASDRLELAWKPRVKKAREIAATVFTQTASVVAFGNNRVSTHTVINYSISQGELRETKVVLPPGKDWKLMKVDGGKQLRTYQLDTQDGQSVLTALLVNGVTQKFQLTLELERGLPAPPIAMPVLLPRCWPAPCSARRATSPCNPAPSWGSPWIKPTG